MGLPLDARLSSAARFGAPLRIFLAVFPPPTCSVPLALSSGAAEPRRRHVSWVKPENLHYTLRFIGEVGGDGLRRIAEAAQVAASQHAAFDAALRRPRRLSDAAPCACAVDRHGARGLGARGARREPRPWLERRGFKPEAQAFTAHLTIGRVREPRADWTDRLAEATRRSASRRFAPTASPSSRAHCRRRGRRIR